MAKNFWKKIDNHHVWWFLLILILGFILRCLLLDQYPVELHSQEALLGWRAKSILETGRDETGRFLPVIFSSLEGYQLPLASYLVIPSVGLFGLTPWVARLPFALIGVLVIPAFYGIIRFLFPKNKKIALWSAFIIAINPWAIYLSRNCSTTHLSFSMFLFGFYFLLLGEKENSRFYWPAISFLTLSLYADKITWFFVPFFLIFIWIYLFGKKRKMLVNIIFILLLFLPLILMYLKAPQVKTDLLAHDLTLISEPAIKTGINLMRGENLQAGFSLLGRIFYNKLFYIQIFIANFLRHFNPRFYFASGDSNPLHGLTNFGPILFLFLPITLMGIWLMWKKHKKNLSFFTGWFCLAILPSVLVLPSPDQTRAIFVLPVLAIITAYCLSRMKKTYLIIFLLLLGFNFLFVLYDAYFKEPLRFQEERQVGYHQLAQYLEANGGSYQKIYLSDAYGADPGPALLFYLNYPPEQFQKDQPQTLFYRDWIDRVDKILINHKELWQLKKGSLFIFAAGKEELTWAKEIDEKIKTINGFDGQPIFFIFKY